MLCLEYVGANKETEFHTVTFHVPNFLGNPLAFHLSYACLLSGVWMFFSFK